jgi:hypothetical protein
VWCNVDMFMRMFGLVLWIFDVVYCAVPADSLLCAVFDEHCVMMYFFLWDCKVKTFSKLGRTIC